MIPSNGTHMILLVLGVGAVVVTLVKYKVLVRDSTSKIVKWKVSKEDQGQGTKRTTTDQLQADQLQTNLNALQANFIQLATAHNALRLKCSIKALTNQDSASARSKPDEEAAAENVQLFRTYRECLRTALDKFKRTGLWHKFPRATRLCSEPLFNPLVLHNKDDVKYVLYPRAASNADCSLITLGIGTDISAEQKFRIFVPGCQMFGADPTAENGAVYKRIGTYVETAVGMRTGMENMSLLIPPGIGHYERRLVQTVEFAQFLRESVIPKLKPIGSSHPVPPIGASSLLTSRKSTKAAQGQKVKVIDHLWIDNEGPEYPMFDKFFSRQDPSMSDITVCQINVEFHGRIENYNYNYTKFDALMSRLVDESDFLPIVLLDPAWHLRGYFFNYKSPLCLLKYFG